VPCLGQREGQKNKACTVPWTLKVFYLSLVTLGPRLSAVRVPLVRSRLGGFGVMRMLGWHPSLDETRVSEYTYTRQRKDGKETEVTVHAHTRQRPERLIAHIPSRPIERDKEPLWFINKQHQRVYEPLHAVYRNGGARCTCGSKKPAQVIYRGQRWPAGRFCGECEALFFADGFAIQLTGHNPSWLMQQVWPVWHVTKNRRVVNHKLRSAYREGSLRCHCTCGGAGPVRVMQNRTATVQFRYCDACSSTLFADAKAAEAFCYEVQTNYSGDVPEKEVV
jgi:hypothetical protein